MDRMIANRATQTNRRWHPSAAGFLAAFIFGVASALAQPATTGTLSQPGQIDEFQFELTQPTLLHFDPQAAADQFTWSLSGPFGPIGSARSFVSADNIENTLLDLSPGNYRIRLNSSGDATGDYRFRLVPLPTGSILPAGVTQVGSLDPGSSAAYYLFTPAPGDRFRLTIPGRTNINSLAAYIVDPFGGVLGTASFGSPTEFTTRTAQPHQIIVNGGTRTVGAGTFSVLLAQLGNSPLYPDATPFTLGTENLFELNDLATNRYLFTLTSPTLLGVNPLALADGDGWRLEGPAGLLNNRVVGHHPAPPGDYLLTLGHSRVSTTTFSFVLHDAGNPPPIVLGESVTMTNTTSARTAYRRLSLTNGQTVAMIADSATGFGGVTPRWEVLKPDGQPLQINGTPIGGLFFDLDRWTAPVTGDYWVAFTQPPYVRGANNSNAPEGVRRFRILNVVDQDLSLTLGQEISGSILTPYAAATYRFQIPANRRLLVDSLESTASFWRLEGAAGLVASGRFDSESIVIQSIPAGDYRIVVRGNARETPNFRFRIIDIDDAPPITLGQAITNAHTPPNGIIAYRIQLNAGQQVLGRAYEATGFPSERPRWTLFEPTGRQLWSHSFSDSSIVATTSSGAHTLLVQGPLGNAGTNPTHRFAILPILQRDEPLAFDTLIDSAITSPGQTITYRFSLAEPRRVSVDHFAYANARWDLFNASRTISSGVFFSDGTWQSDLAPGDYRLVVSASSIETPSYRFRVLDSAAGTFTTLDATNNITLAPATSSRYLRIALTAGQTIYLDHLGNTNMPGGVGILITDPLGNSLVNQSINDIGPLVVRATGIHDILIQGRMGNPETPGITRFALRSADAIAAPYLPGTAVSASILVPGQVQRYRWNQPTLQHFLVDSLLYSPVTWTVNGAWGTAATSRLYTEPGPFEVPAGDAEILLRDDGDLTNPFRFRLVPLEGSPVVPIGVESEVQLTPAAAMAVVAVDLAAGQQVNLRTITRTGFNFTPGWNLYNPRFANAGGSSLNPFSYRAVQAGLHYLVLHGNIQEDGTGGTIRFIIEDGGTIPPAPFNGPLVAFNQLIEGTPASTTETNFFRLLLSETRLVAIDSLLNGGNLWTLRDRFGTRYDRVRLRDSDNPNRSDTQLMKLLPGEYELAVMGSTDPFRFRLLDASNATALPPDAWVSDIHTPGNSVRLYRFDGIAGEPWTLEGGTATGNSRRPTYTLFQPSGGYVTWNYADTLTDRYALPETGRYFLVLSSANDESGASTTNQFRWVTPQETVTDIALNTPFDVQITAPGRRALFRLILTEPREVMLDAIGRANQITVTIDHQGTRLLNQNLASTDIDGTAAFTRLQLGAGEYRITFDANSDATPSLRAAVWDIHAGRPITFNTEVTGTNSPAPMSTFYSVDLRAGETYFFEGLGVSGYSSAVYADLLFPEEDGIDLSTLTSYSSRFTPPRTGRASLLVSGSHTDTGTNGIHRFKLWRVVDETRPLALGEVVAGEILQPSQRQIWTFRLNQPRLLLLDSLTNANAYARLSGPGGQYFDTLIRQLDSSALRLLPGDYSLSVYGSGTDRPAYQFRLQDITDAPLLSLDTVTPASFDLPLGTFIRRIRGTTGQALFHDVVEYSGFPGGTYNRLIKPDGVVLWEAFGASDAGAFNLPYSGDYYFIANAPNFNPATPPTYRFRFVSNPTPSPESLLGNLSLADLVPESITATPNPVVSGAALTVRWSTANRGNAATTGPLTDRVVIRNASGAAVATASTTDSSGPLQPGQARSRELILPLPDGAPATGALAVEVSADSAGSIREANAAGTGEANNLAIVGVTGTLAPYPDLQVLGLGSVSATWAPGSPIELRWTTTNSGTRIANGPWNERLVISNVTRRVVLLDTTIVHPASLNPGSASARSHTFTLPSGANGYGSFAVYLTVDSGNSLTEFNADDTAESNNTAAFLAATALDLAITEVSAPSVIEPGVPFNVVHTLTNAGAILGSGTWLDALTFIAPDGTETILAQRSQTASLPPGSALRITNSLSIPVNFPHPSGRIAVATDSAGVFAETSESNNRAESEPLTIPPVLTLQISPTSLREDAINPIARASLTRNGPTTLPLSVTVSSSAPDELIAPPSVVIPAGQSSTTFDVTVQADGLNDGDQAVTIAAAATGFRSAQAAFTVIDADLTRLTLVLSTNQIPEGGSLTGQISRSPVAATALVVQLIASDTAQILAPGSVVIPGGAASAQFPISAIEDDLVERTNLYTIVASAPGIPPVSSTVGVADNDIPTVTVTLTQRTVSEGDGANATSATITRSPVSARALVIQPTAGNSTAVRLPSTATIPANQASVTIPVGTVDNTTADGPRPVAIGGSILDSTTRLPIRDIIADVLTVTDDDGPTLTLRIAADAVAEGRSPATTATVLRNTSTAQALTVTLGSSDLTEATVPASVVIPAGANQATFPIASLSDGTTDGNQSVLITASASGFVSGSDTLVVSDADRPDLVVAAISFPTNAVGGESIPVSIRVENRGATPVAGSITQRLSISTDAYAGNDTLLGQISYPGPLAAGGSFEQTLNVRLPDQPGTYHFVAETDVGNAIVEILESNNLLVTPGAVRVNPAYTATVETDVTTGIAGSPVPLTGRALKLNGTPAPLSAVTIHVAVRGITRTLPVVSGPDGRFSAIFQPLPTEGGLYQISAGHPGAAMPPAQDEFRLLGMALAPLPTMTVAEGESTTAEVLVANRTDLPLTGLVTEIVTAHPSLSVSATLTTNTLVGSGNVTLRIQVTAVDTSAVESNVSIRIRSAEGAEGLLTTRVRQLIRVPRLVATPVAITAAMVRGRQTPVAFSIRNDGGLDTGPLSIAIPSSPWLSLSSPALLQSLPPGSNATVTLLLTPGADLPLGNYSSAIAFNSERAVLSVPAQFQAISDGIGDLVVAAEDEYTYFAEGKPPLADAEVILRDAITGTAVRTNRTGLDGRASFPNLTEAYYLVSVTADRHRSFLQTALVTAGATTNVIAFLSRETVRYSFFVEPTTVEDSYSLRVESVFETQVPVPVVVIEPASIDISKYSGEEFQVEITVRNHGLITANSVRIDIPGGAWFTATPLVTDLGDLPGGASVKVPILIRRPARTSGNRLAGPALDDEFDDVSCSIAAQALWNFVCRTPLQQASPFSIFNARNSPTDRFGCDDSELYTRVFEYRDIPYWTQPGASPQVAAFIATLPTVPFNWSAMTTFWRMCRPAADLGALGPGSRPAATAAGDEPARDVCAKVSLQLDQSAVLTRDAFRATLQVENDTETPLDSILVNLEIRRPNGTNVTELFGIRPAELEAFSGIDGSGTLPANATGRARWTLIPSLDVSPTNGPTVLLVSGTLSYSQGGTNLSIPLAQAPITVYPQPELIVDYFHERDVYSDDPFTLEVEPSIPYSLALQVRNVGFGNARGLRIKGGQPQIVDNEKGLVIEFKTLATQLEDQPLSPSLDIDLGAIPSGTNRIARWLFSSSIQGSFTNFAASFEHTDALGGRRLSLVREVHIHELSRIVRAGPPDNDARPDMLVNESTDPDVLPDRVYLSNGSDAPVQAITSGQINPTGNPGVYQLALAPVSGWAYIRAQAPPDAGNLLRVVRPDGTEIPAGNAWLTDRFIRGGALRPIRTNLFHLFEGAPGGTYQLVFGEAPQVVADTTAPESRVNALPATVPVDFTVSWSGTDTGGSGIVRYDVLYSVDNGAFTPWLQETPATSALFRGEPGRRYAFLSIATDRSGNREPNAGIADATTTTAVGGNRPPTFTGGLAATVDELDFLSGTLAASDPDAGQQVSFSIVSGAPGGFVLDGTSGRYSWNPSEADGPRTWNILVRASDNGSPIRTADATLAVTVREMNRRPSLATPADRLLTQGSLLSFNLVGEDPDRPAQALRYSLVSGPAGASVNATSGLFLWRPRPDQAGRQHIITVRVSDNATPPLSVDASFTVGVRDTSSDLLIAAGLSVVENGNPGTIPFSINAPPDLTDIGFDLELPESRVANLAIASLASDVSGATLVPLGGGRSEFRLQLRPGASLLSARPLLTLGYAALPASNSALVRVTPDSVAAKVESGANISSILSRSGRLVLIGADPLLVLESSPDPTSNDATLVVYGTPGLRYALEARAAYRNEVPWSSMAEGEILAGEFSETWSLPVGTGEAWFRARTTEPR
jgi:hypothetical protein